MTASGYFSNSRVALITLFISIESISTWIYQHEHIYDKELIVTELE